MMRRTLAVGLLAGLIAFGTSPPPANNLKENSVTMIMTASLDSSPDIGLNTGPAGDDIGIALMNGHNFDNTGFVLVNCPFDNDNGLGVARAPAPAASLAMYSDSASARAPAMAASRTCSYTVGTASRHATPCDGPLHL